MSLTDAAEDLTQQAEEFERLELSCLQFESRDNEDSFLIVGVSETNEEAIEKFEQWRDSWQSELRFADESGHNFVPVSIHRIEQT
jgi:hypothetical protein